MEYFFLAKPPLLVAPIGLALKRKESLHDIRSGDSAHVKNGGYGEEEPYSGRYSGAGFFAGPPLLFVSSQRPSRPHRPLACLASGMDRIRESAS